MHEIRCTHMHVASIKKNQLALIWSHHHHCIHLGTGSLVMMTWETNVILSWLLCHAYLSNTSVEYNQKIANINFSNKIANMSVVVICQ